MRKTVIVVVLAALCLLAVGHAATAAPSAATQVGSVTPSTPPVPLSDAEMARVVGGQINVPPPGAGSPPEPPLSGYIKTLVEQYGVPPGQVGSLFGGQNGLANFIRMQFPTGTNGLGQLLH